MLVLRNLTVTLLGLCACWPTTSSPSRQGVEPTHAPEAVATVEVEPAPAPQQLTPPAAQDKDEEIVVVDDPVGPGSWRTTSFVTVRAEPRFGAAELGVIAPGSRLPRRARTKDRACAQGWLEVDPRGFVCADLVADTRAPDDTLLPAVPRGAVIPGTYAKVRNTGILFDSVDAVRAGEGRRSEAALTVRRLGKVEVDGKKYWRTRHGLVAASGVRTYKGSRFQGVELTKDVELPVAWTIRGEDRFTVPLRAAPSNRAKVVRRIGPRERVPVLAISDDGAFVEIDSGAWIDRGSVKIARATEPPEGLLEGERWIDVDLDEQTLVAYEGETPVYATLVSSGKVLHRTPTGVFRIERKVAERTMNSMLDASEEYTVDKVPWTAYFAHGYALHAAYWHNGFGQPRSHGCINLAPIDARRLYAWTAPAVAPGWVESYGHAEQPGSIVRVRSAKDPEPRWKGYAAALRPASQQTG